MSCRNLSYGGGLQGGSVTQTALITGASSGIGLACAQLLAEQNMNLILISRRKERLEELAKTLKDNHGVEVKIVSLDVQNPESIPSLLQAIEGMSVDILINSAGLALGLEKVQEGNLEHWNQMIDTNVKGLLYMTRAILPLMLHHNRGHVINIGSISAHGVYPGGSVYCATKHAVKALTEGLKMEVHGTAIRVTEIDPGLVETEFSQVRFEGDQGKARAVYEGMTPLTARDIAETVLFCITRPAHVNILEMKIYPTDQSALHLIHKQNQ
jgi:3-hydroxy acid dehydrogenase/malonic semialdehyde reductase